jgi:hypothetical protein
MSHLLEAYSLQTGSKIGKPFIVKNFFPTPERYITIHNSSGMGAKNYDYFQEVIEEILPELSKANISLIQIGTQEDQPLNGCIHFQGKTSYHQTAYILENSMLHIGNDSFPVHLASASNTPIVALYSITTPEIAGPVFNKDHNLVKCLTPNYNGKKPSFNPNESPKTVNSIKVEEVIKNIYDILSIDPSKLIETILIGDNFKKQHVEFIPNGILNPEKFKNVPVAMRIDLLAEGQALNENIIFSNLNLRKFYIHVCESKKIENIELLRSFRSNIAEYIIDVTNEKISKDYIKNIVEAGIKPIIFYKGIDNEYLNEIKIDLIDYNLRILNTKINNDEIDDILNRIKNLENLWIKTSCPIISDSKIFLSEEHYKNNISSEDPKQKIDKKINLKNLLLKKDNIFLFTYNEK